MRRGDEVTITGEGLKFAARALAGAQSRPRDPPRLDHPPAGGRQGRVEHRPGAPRSKRRWCRSIRPTAPSCALAGGFDFNAQQVQPRDAGVAPTRIELQAVHLLGGPGKGLHAGHRAERRAVRDRCGQDRGPALGAAELRQQVRWARCACAPPSTKSKNMVSIRLLQAIGPGYAQDYIQRFGFDPKMHPAYLTMALGAGSATPLQMATAYSVFANGGYRVKPWFIARIEDASRRDPLRGQARDGGRGCRARARRAQCLPHDLPDARRRAPRHGGEGDVAGPRRPGRQDRHHQRPRRRLVLRLPVRSWSPWPGSDSTRRRAWAATRRAARRRCRSGWRTPARSSRACPRPSSTRRRESWP